MNVYGEFDEYDKILKLYNIKKIILIKNNLIKFLPKKGFFWSRLNYILIFLFGFFPLLNYLQKNKKDILFVYLISSLPFIISSIFNLKNKIIFRVSGRIKYSFLRKAVWFLAKNKIDRILIQTKTAKKLLIEKKIFKKKKILYVEDPIIDLNKINILKKQKIEKNSLIKIIIYR